MFAGAAREAVFSNPEVIRRINVDFVPVALKAGLVNAPPDDVEGRLYQEIGRSKPAPQGICVVNSAGKVLDWVLMFDNDKSVLSFLDHSAKRFARFPAAKKPVAAERYMRFPSAKLADVADTGKVGVLSDRHPKGKHCPATPRVRPGTVLVRLFGRALDKDGKPLADTLRQEHYVEDRFQVPVAMQEALATALAQAGTRRFRLADDLARLLVSHAYLGQLDVNPLGGIFPTRGALKHCAFRAQKVEGDKDAVWLRIAGRSEAAGVSREDQRRDGRIWQHEVKLVWEGLIKIKKDRVACLLLVARGSEKLQWGNKHQGLKDHADVTVLPGGHAIDLRCGVRYGIIGEPVAADQSDADDADQEDQPRRQLSEAFGPMFLVFRAKVQQDLKVSKEQKQKLAKRLHETVQDAQQFFETLANNNPEERDKKLHSYRQKATRKLAAFLKGTLKDEQLKRLRQVELQQEGVFALLARPDLGKELKITHEQRKQFMTIIQKLQKKIEPLLKEAQSGGNPQEIGPKIMKVRKQQAGRIKALLTDAQQKQWQKMRGKPLDLDD